MPDIMDTELSGTTPVAGKNEPEITQVIDAIVAVCLGKKKPAEVFNEYAPELKNQCFIFAKEQTAHFIKDHLQKSKQKELQELSENEFADRLIDSMLGIGKLIQDYFHKGISLSELINGLSGTGIKEVAVDAIEALGIPEKIGAENLEAVFLMSPQVVAYSALTAAYQEVMKALQDNRIAHEQRLQMEAECDRIVASIAKYRTEMDNIISKHLSEHYSAFEKGFAAMDQAIIENDVDGYIRGNVEIQKVLGYHAQFASQKEFDDLMLSDDAFRL